MTVPRENALYPFLESSREIVQDYDAQDMFEDEEIRQRAAGRVIHSITSDEIGESVDDNEIELLSYPLARIMVSLLDEHRVTSQYAKAEARTAINRMMRGDGDRSVQDTFSEFGFDPSKVEFDVLADNFSEFWDDLDVSERESIRETLEKASEETGFDDIEVDVGFQEFASMITNPLTSLSSESKYYTIAINNYLRHMPTRGSDKWKLPNRSLYKGRVIVSESEIETLLREAIHARISERLPLDVPSHFKDRLEEELNRIHMAIPDEMFSIDIERVEQEKFPPVISTLLERIQRGDNLTHMERFTVASFLINIGMSNGEILDLFGVDDNTPNFVEDATLYQLEHIRNKGGDGEPYTPPTYDTIESWGTNWQSDELESEVNHPLVYYRIKLEEMEEGEE